MNQAIRNLIPFDLQHDAKHELFISLYEKEEKDNGFIEKGTNEGWLIWYCIRTLMNFTRGSKFKRDYLNYNFEPIDYDSNILNVKEEEASEINIDARIDRLLECLEPLNNVERRIFEDYAFGENISEFSRNSGVPRKTLLNIINKVKSHLESKIITNDILNGNPTDDISDRIQSVWQLELF